MLLSFNIDNKEKLSLYYQEVNSYNSESDFNNDDWEILGEDDEDDEDEEDDDECSVTIGFFAVIFSISLQNVFFASHNTFSSS